MQACSIQYAQQLLYRDVSTDTTVYRSKGVEFNAPPDTI